MLVLFETSAGFAVFKVINEKKITEADLYAEFSDAENVSKILKLQKFVKFSDTTEALKSATALVEGKISKKLNKLLKKLFVKEVHDETLAVADSKLACSIKEKYDVSCIHNAQIQDLMRAIRSQTAALIPGMEDRERAAMSLGLAHSLSRYKLKFSPDKVDTMIVQAINLLDDIDKEVNNCSMRTKEMYGWHFPELSKIVTDNIQYIKTVLKMGRRENIAEDDECPVDLSDILEEDLIDEVREAAKISLGTELTDEDVAAIHQLCEEVLEASQQREQLYEYLKNRMMAVAPNLTVLVGELVGARLIKHAGTLLNLAKHPASTVQILGAEKALFRALKTRHATPKYGLLYHAQLVGQANAKVKGKMSRMLAAKAALMTRVDALGEAEEMDSDLGLQHRAALNRRLQFLEEGQLRRISGTGKFRAQATKFTPGPDYGSAETDGAGDFKLGKRKRDDTNGGESSTPAKSPPKKKMKTEVKEEEADEEEAPTSEKKKKKKKVKEEPEEEMEEEVPTSEKKKKKKKKKSMEAVSVSDDE